MQAQGDGKAICRVRVTRMGSSDTLRARPEEERSLNSRAAATSFLTSSNAPISSRASSGVGGGGVRAGERRGWRDGGTEEWSGLRGSSKERSKESSRDGGQHLDRFSLIL